MTDKRDFEYGGLRFHLNDNSCRMEYEGKYRVLFWNEAYGHWQDAGYTCSSLREAAKFARIYCERRHYPFD